MAMIPLRFRRLLHQGSIGPDVIAVKRALKKVGYPTGITLTPRLGNKAVANLKRFQKAVGLVADGQYGPRTHARLEPFFDAYGRRLYWLPLPSPPLSKLRSGIVAYCRWGISNERAIHYAQVRPIPTDPYALPKYTDCSGFAKSAYHAAHAPSPDGLDWGSGNTDSLLQHGRRVVAPKPGDLVFYRHPDHVGVYTGKGRVTELGGEDGPKDADEWYRSVTDIRSYLP